LNRDAELSRQRTILQWTRDVTSLRAPGGRYAGLRSATFAGRGPGGRGFDPVPHPRTPGNRRIPTWGDGPVRAGGVQRGPNSRQNLALASRLTNRQVLSPSRSLLGFSAMRRSRTWSSAGSSLGPSSGALMHRATRRRRRLRARVGSVHALAARSRPQPAAWLITTAEREVCRATAKRDGRSVSRWRNLCEPVDPRDRIDGRVDLGHALDLLRLPPVRRRQEKALHVMDYS
jgi:hypothetical protein